ncbi:hypothetical protein TURU_144124 [Turdus rufiventris]|nr:hypothetical protein TURU_144124 [Turdus rufiventris]
MGSMGSKQIEKHKYKVSDNAGLNQPKEVPEFHSKMPVGNTRPAKVRDAAEIRGVTTFHLYTLENSQADRLEKLYQFKARTLAVLDQTDKLEVMASPGVDGIHLRALGKLKCGTAKLLAKTFLSCNSDSFLRRPLSDNSDFSSYWQLLTVLIPFLTGSSTYL